MNPNQGGQATLPPGWCVLRILLPAGAFLQFPCEAVRARQMVTKWSFHGYKDDECLREENAYGAFAVKLSDVVAMHTLEEPPRPKHQTIWPNQSGMN